MTGTPCLKMPNDRTELKARAEGHSQTPWSLEALGDSHLQFLDSDGLPVQGVLFALDSFAGYETKGGWRREVRTKNPKARNDAAFINLTVNSYDAMRAALEHSLTFARHELELREPSGDPEYIGYAKKAVEAAEAALAIARGEKP